MVVQVTEPFADIYVLQDGPTRSFYIGKSSDPAKRFKSYKRKALNGKGTSAVHSWLQGILGDGREPELKVLARDVRRSECSEREAEYVRSGTERGFRSVK